MSPLFGKKAKPEDKAEAERRIASGQPSSLDPPSAESPEAPPPGDSAGGAGDADGEFLLPKKSRDYLKNLFKQLVNPVDVLVFTKGDEKPDAYEEFCLKFTGDLSRLSDLIRVQTAAIDSDLAREHEVDRSPTILVQPDLYHIRYLGAPSGEEGRSFIETVLHVSARDSGLSSVSREILGALTESRLVRVFVSPSCPYCPMQVLNAFKAAIERPKLVRAECVEIVENADLADRFNVHSVPHTVFQDKLTTLGLEPEERFMAELVTLEPASTWERKAAQGAAGQEAGTEDADLVIVGAGPAGLTAGIYAARAGLSAIILERKNVGGQVAVTPVVENYPGFANIAGAQLVDLLTQHSRQYVDVRENEEVVEIKVGKRLEAITPKKRYRCRALLFATGADWKQLGAPGELEFFGHGVSYCSSCDGYLYKGKKVVVVGGGNTALTDALYLKNLGCEATVVHRRDQLRAEKHLQEAAEREGVPLVLNSVVQEIVGRKQVEGVRVKNVETGEERVLECQGVFVAIGERPNAKLAEDIGLKLRENGSIWTDDRHETSIPRIYAAGDITSEVRQIVTAVGQGAAAAVHVFEDLSKRGLREEAK